MTDIRKCISTKIGRAIRDFDMLEDGDRIAVGVSGGKDSLSLLEVLRWRQRFSKVKYEVLAIHIDMGYGCVHHRKLKDYFKDSGCKSIVEKINILDTVGGDRSKISCFWCSWNRRKKLFAIARKHKCKKVALGHHRDDIIQTLLMNMFYHGNTKAMAPKQEMFKGKIHIIRPLAYVAEVELEKFARQQNFPVACCKCPNANNTKRDFMRGLIAKIEKVAPKVRSNLFTAADLSESPPSRR